jgi:hypothetical protein
MNPQNTQTSATHTPGPWHMIPDASDFTRAVSRSPAYDPFPIARVNMGKTHATDEDFAELKANARLIAAAPDLLAALESACDDITLLTIGRCPRSLVDEIMQRYTQARAAIARAKGVQS